MDIGKMRIDKLKMFSDALNALPENIKNNKFDIGTTNKPFNSVRNHAVLVSFVDLPELKNIYHSYELGCYDYFYWILALSEFLGLMELGVEFWAKEYPHLWEGKHGNEMFSHHKAFDQKTNTFKSQVIIDKWNRVHQLCTQQEEKQNGQQRS